MQLRRSSGGCKNRWMCYYTMGEQIIYEYCCFIVIKLSIITAHVSSLCLHHSLITVRMPSNSKHCRMTIAVVRHNNNLDSISLDPSTLH